MSTPEEEFPSPFPTKFWCNSPRTQRKAQDQNEGSETGNCSAKGTHAEGPTPIYVIHVPNNVRVTKKRWSLYLFIIATVILVFLASVTFRVSFAILYSGTPNDIKSNSSIS
ncbi:unnamed protein product, partial [Nesidiocoris tenuis]